MSSWYDLPGALDVEKSPFFIEKSRIDIDDVYEKPIHATCHKNNAIRGTGRVMKAKHKQKLIRQFLSINPGLDYTQLKGTGCETADFWSIQKWNDDETKDFMVHVFNPYTKTYLSKRGNIRRFYGKIENIHKGHFNTNSKVKYKKRLKNSRIRHMRVDEEGGLSYTYAKKACTTTVY